MIFFNSVVITGISFLCYLLRKDLLWCLTVAGILSMEWLYEYSTPPSAVVALLLVLFTLLTLYISEHKDPVDKNTLAIWSLLAGLSIATRADIGGITTLAMSIFLVTEIGWKKVLKYFALAGLVFAVFDPYIWYMPVRHIGDLFSKMFYHYAEFTVPYHMTFVDLMSISSLACIAIGLAIAFIFFPKRFVSPISRKFLLILIILTIFLYTIFLTSQYQAPRYFMPIIFVWESFLPLFIFSFIPHIHFDSFRTISGQELSRQSLKIFMAFILVGYMAISLVNSLWFNSLFYLLPWQH